MPKKERIDEIKEMFKYLNNEDEIWVEIVSDLTDLMFVSDRITHCAGGRGQCPLNWELIKVNKHNQTKTIAKWDRVNYPGKQYEGWKDNIYYPGLMTDDHYNVTECGEIYGRLPNFEFEGYCSKSLNLQNNYYLYI